ncbi:MAG: DMT family transporter [Desulfoprunum sp.]|uniref:DMT family transporter n=1 Tax=Desulfoprunum sp. TaxID=2020866 RepID=UPI003C789DDD
MACNRDGGGMAVSGKSPRWLPMICLVTAMVLWASSFIALKVAFRAYAPMIVIWGRMVVGSLCFLFLLPLLRQVRLRRRDLRYLVLMAVCEPCIYFIFEAKAMELTTASQAGMITAILPLLVAIGATIFLGERIARHTVAGFVLAMVGAGLLSVSGETTADAPNPLLGNFLEFLAMVSAMGYTISLKHLSSSYSPLFLTAIQSWVGAVFFSFFLLSPATVMPTEFVPLPAMAVFYLGSCVTIGAYFLYNFGVSKLPASQASAYINMIPVFTVIMGFLFLGETFTRLQVLASLLVFLGIYVSQKRPHVL